jgi:hypothetical protein
VIRLDAEIPVLTARLATAREAVAGADAALRRAWQAREAAVTRIRASLIPAPALPSAPAPAFPSPSPSPSPSAPAPAFPSPSPSPSAPAPAFPSPPPRTPRTREASTRLVQNALFLLGGLLLAVAAIVFTAVAWSQFGVGGRALLLAGCTVATLAAPLVALRRGLTATAETFAAVGLLLVLLDGYAAWYVNLFGVADYSALGYAGAVCAVTAAVAAGYEQATGLVGPRFGALLVAQPVLPLLVAPFHPDATGWAYALVAVALLNLAVVQLRRSGMTPLGVTAYLLGAGAVTLAGLSALTGLVMRSSSGAVALAAAALVLAAAVPVAAAVLARVPLAQSITGGLLVVALAVAAGRFAAVAGGSFAAPVLIVAVVTALAVLVAVVQRGLPAPVRRGPWIGALLVVTCTGTVVLGVTIAAAATGRSDWRLPAVIVLLTGALTALVSRPLQPHVVLGGLAVLAVAAPAGFGLPWWTAPGLDLLVVAAALALALRAAALWPAAVAAVLTTHAVTVAFARPWVACATFIAVAALGLATAFAARRGSRLLGGVVLAAGLLAVPAAAWTGAAALSLPYPVQSRLALAGAALLVGALRFAGPGYQPYALAAALLGVVSAPVWALISGDSPAIYAAVGLLLVALTFARTVWAAWAALPLGTALLVAVAPSLAGVLLAPYGRLGHIWSGRPAGTGVGAVTLAAVVALSILAVAVVVAVQAASGRRTAAWAVAPVVAVLAPAGFAALGVPWPGVPAESLVIGLGGLLTVTLWWRGAGAVGAVAERLPGWMVSGVVVTCSALAGAGLAGALPTRGATLAALGLTLVAGAVAGVRGRVLVARLAGWLVGAGATVAFAFTVGRAVELSPATSAFVVLGAAAVILAVGAVLAVRRAVEGRTVQVAAHAGAFVALLLTAGSIRHAAAVCTFWGLALGVRALRPGEAGPVRRGHVLAAAVAELGGWWLLVASERVATVEAYTLPAAGVALLAGWLARRSRTGLSSWVTYGPALAAALLPTLASVLAGEGQPLRRLLLGVGALAVLLAGAHGRLRAPVVAGGTVLAVVALHELVLVWDLLPRWIPLAAAGLLLVALAMTLERRRRDLSRIRAALTRMG